MTDPSTRTEAASRELSCGPLAVQRSARRWGDLRITERRFTALQITTVFVVCLVTLASTATVSSAKPPPPAKRTYFVTIVGGGEELGELDFDCLKFNNNGTHCFGEGVDTVCGTWERIEPSVDDQSIITFDFDFTDEGVEVKGEGRLTVDSRGPRGKKRSSVGGTAVVDADGMTFTLAVAGKQAKAKKCRTVRDDLQDRLGDGD